MSELLLSKNTHRKVFIFFLSHIIKFPGYYFVCRRKLNKETNKKKKKKKEGCKVTPTLASRFFCYLSLQSCSESIAFCAGRNL